MARNHKPEEIVGKLREVEIVLAQGGTIAEPAADRCYRAEPLPLAQGIWRPEVLFEI